jgi:hypothetical protein
MAEPTKGKESPSRRGAAVFKDTAVTLGGGSKAAIELAEKFALETQRQWAIASETYIKIWGQLTRTAVDLAVSASVAQSDAVQNTLDRLKGDDQA